MNQRNLIATAIKILGLCLLVLGLLAVWRDGAATYFSHQIIQQSVVKQNAEGDNSSNQRQSDISITIQQIQRTQNLTQLGFSIVQVLVGLYLCRRGTVVLNFLAGRCNDKKSQISLSSLFSRINLHSLLSWTSPISNFQFLSSFQSSLPHKAVDFLPVTGYA